MLEITLFLAVVSKTSSNDTTIYILSSFSQFHSICFHNESWVCMWLFRPYSCFLVSFLIALSLCSPFHFLLSPISLSFCFIFPFTFSLLHLLPASLLLLHFHKLICCICFVTLVNGMVLACSGAKNAFGPIWIQAQNTTDTHTKFHRCTRVKLWRAIWYE